MAEIDRVVATHEFDCNGINERGNKGIIDSFAEHVVLIVYESGKAIPLCHCRYSDLNNNNNRCDYNRNRPDDAMHLSRCTFYSSGGKT